MPEKYSGIDVKKLKHLAQFKIDYERVHVLEYVNREETPPQSFAVYRKSVVPLALTTEEQARPTFPTDLRYLQAYSALQFPRGKMLILVNYDLYPQVKSALDQYVMDVAYEGFFAVVYRVRGGTPSELREFIKSKRPIVGALMVGNLPVAWFEMSDDFHGAAEFPCDLYFMDLDGTWKDPDHDGKFSEHPTGVTPEIWVGRLWTPTSQGNDKDLINNYFARNHSFRKGRLGYCNRALAYVDDDWTGFGDCALDMMFPAPNVETITDPATTDGDRYKVEVNEQRAWAQICSHSNPSLHSFKVPGAPTETVPFTYLKSTNPPNAYFYNLFACSSALFTTPDYMAGWYIFDMPGGLTCYGMSAVGSTKSGSMLAFENFYGPMGSGRLLGDAYVAWWRALGSSHELNERQWHYGMVLLGDPTINWWSGVVPGLVLPAEGATFSNFPRVTNFRWNPTVLSNATVSYDIEIDAFGARAAGKWAAEVGQRWLVAGPLTATNYQHVFVGAQRGRWRVRARVGALLCPWTDWRYFRYTV